MMTNSLHLFASSLLYQQPSQESRAILCWESWTQLIYFRTPFSCFSVDLSPNEWIWDTFCPLEWFCLECLHTCLELHTITTFITFGTSLWCNSSLGSSSRQDGLLLLSWLPTGSQGHREEQFLVYGIHTLILETSWGQLLLAFLSSTTGGFLSLFLVLWFLLLVSLSSFFSSLVSIEFLLFCQWNLFSIVFPWLLLSRLVIIAWFLDENNGRRDEKRLGLIPRPYDKDR